MDQEYVDRILTTLILIGLVVLGFFIIKPIILAIVSGVLLAFIFTPVYTWTLKYVKWKDLAATLICIFLLAIIILPTWFFMPMIVDQSIKLYYLSQNIDFTSIFQKIFPSFFSSEEFSKEVGSITFSFVTKLTNQLMNSFSGIILDFPNLLLKVFVALFTFFFVLRDKEELVAYIKSLLPFNKDIERRLFESSRDITNAILYGQVIIGFVQGIIVGIGFFLFGVSNAFFLTLLAIAFGVLPILGTPIIWAPVAIYLVIAGNNFAALGVTIFGLIGSTIDNLLRPLFVSRKTKIASSLILVGMIGGFFLLGILGLILGPLILAYLFIILEIYRKKPLPGGLVQA